MAARHPPIRTFDLIYASMYTPAGCLTEAQWLQDGFRVKGEHSTQLLILHDYPHDHKRPSEEPFPAEEVEALRLRLKDDEYPSDEDRRLIHRMDMAAQVSWCNLYPEDAVVPITTPTQTQAWNLLSNLWRHGSHKTEFIFGGYDDAGEKYVWTAGRKIAKDWNILDHKKGDHYLGVKRGEYTRVIDIDLDRHDGGISAADHLRMVMDTLRFLQRVMPWAAPHVSNINPRNGSCHVTLYLPRAIPVWQARAVVADIRSECSWLSAVEIYPDSCPQFILPLRRDKVTVLDKVLTPSVKAHCHARPPAGKKKKRHGRKPRGPRVGYLAMDAVAYWSWIMDEDRQPCGPGLVERELRKACQVPLDGGKPGKSRPGGRKHRDKAKHDHDGMAGIGKLKGRCARTLVDFFSGGEPLDDIRKYAAVGLRVLRNVDGLDMGPAIDWTRDRLDRHPCLAGRPVADRPRLSRMIRDAAKAIWRDNGYQADPLGSLDIWKKVKVAWDRRGFRLSDPSTWNRAGKATLDDARDLVWSPWVLGLVPGLAREARGDMEKARRLLRLACVHIANKAEMSLSFLARIMAEAGVASYRNNVVRVRRFLEANGVIVLRKRGFRWGDDSGVGNHYTLGLMVEIADPGQDGLVVLPPAGEGKGGETSNYPSSGRMDVGPLVERMRLKRCLEHYYERVRAVGGG